MTKAKIQALDNGPLLVTGDVELVDGEGNKIETPEHCALCRCGLSTNAPFCSGAHQGKFNNEVRVK